MKINFRLFAAVFVLFNFVLIPKLSADQENFSLADRDVKISMDLTDASLKSVLKILSIQSGLNFVASDTVQDRKLTLYMDNVPLREAMDNIFKANNLTYDLDKSAGVFIVNDWGKPQVQTVTKVFYLKYASVSSSSLKEEMKNSMNAAASTSSGSSTAMAAPGTSSGGLDSGKWKSDSDSGITPVIRKLLSKDGYVIEDFRTNSLTVTDIPSRLEVITQVIASLDVPVPQVMLEVEMLDVTKQVVDAMGVKFGGSVLTAALDPADPSTGVRTGTTAGLGFPWQSAGKIFPPANGLNFKLGSTLTAQLDWLKTQTDTKFLARPKLRTLNNETAEIRIVTDEAIGVSTVTTSTTGTSSATAERSETGISLRVTPQIDINTGEVTMFIYPQVSEAIGTSTITAGNSGTFIFRNPEVRSTKSVVKVKDGETIMLGGLIRNETILTTTKVPILGDIPLIGGFFRHKSNNPATERELLVFITPHIIRDGKTDLAQAEKTALPLREQAKVSALTRQQNISAYMNNFEAKR